jgi:hypothetical protein
MHGTTVTKKDEEKLRKKSVKKLKFTVTVPSSNKP